MALLRMTAVALVACRPAAAEPTPAADPTPAARAAADSPGAPPAASAPHGAPPAGWTQLPAITTAVAAVASDGAASSVAVDAWGQPATGCYAVWLELHGASGDALTLADQVLGGLTGLTITERVKPTAADGVLAFAFARPPYRGRLRAQLGHGRIAAVACFGNPREPIACDTICARVLQDVR